MIFQNANLLVAFSEISDGNMSSKYSDDYMANREKLLKSLKLSSQKATMMNLVDNGSICLSDELESENADCEALITKEINHLLLLLTADCIPAIIYEKKKNILAILHLSFKNTDECLLAKAIDFVKEQGADPNEMMLILGPGIRQESYYFENSPKLTSDWSVYSAVKNNRIYFDLFGFNKNLAMANGIKDENTIDLNIDTFRDEKFYSHRRSAAKHQGEGRFMSVAVMQEVDCLVQ